MKTILSILLVFISITSLFGQEEYSKGFWVDTQNDTLFGYIDRGYGTNGDYLLFKRGLGAEINRIEASKVSTIFLESGDYFVVRNIKVNKDSIRVFLRCMIEGSISLYYRLDNQLSTRYFIESERRGFQELRVRKDTFDVVKDNPFKRTRTVPLYLNEFSLAFGDCYDKENGAEKYTFNKVGLRKAVRRYYKCSGLDYKEFQSKSNRKTRPKIGVIGGAFSHNLGNLESIYDYEDLGYQFGVNLIFYHGKSEGKYSIEMGAQYSEIKGQRRTGSINARAIKTFKSINVPIIVNRNFMMGNGTISVGAGIEFSDQSASKWLIGSGFDYKFKNILLTTDLQLVSFSANRIRLNFGIYL